MSVISLQVISRLYLMFFGRAFLSSSNGLAPWSTYLSAVELMCGYPVANA